ncbi:MAG: NUDIX hydrolase [Acidimicrobiales bacterium]
MTNDQTVRAAGGVVRRRTQDGNTEVLLVHRPKYDDWTFPKGKLTAGEAHPDAARREVTEETGLSVSLDRELPEVSYRDSAGRPKIVRYWAMSPLGGEFAPNHEVDETRWVPVEDARSVLSYDHDRRLLDCL